LDKPRIVVIGAGSTEFTPGLIADLAATPRLHGATLALVDIVPERVETMARFAERVIRERGVDLRVEAATDRRGVLPGASFVTTTIAVGGARGWETDVRIPERYGIFQTVGDTVGPGGVLRALRHVPVLVDLARDMEELCPDAWLFNYTNPMSVLVRAVQRTSAIRCAGLCHGALHSREMIARDLGIPASELGFRSAGLNHLAWVLDLCHHGVDVYPRFRELVRAGLSAADPDPEGDPYEIFQQVSARVMELYGLYPIPGDRHVAEFFSFFLRQRGATLDFGTQPALDMTNAILGGKDALWERIAAQADGRQPLDAQWLGEDGEGERLVKIVEAIVHDDPLYEIAVNVPNHGLIPNLPGDAIVEVPGYISGFGVQGLSVGPLPPGIADVLTRRISQQELTVAAALGGDRALAVQALLADPLVPDARVAGELLDEMLAAHAASPAPLPV
jgi:alpha-galactosidase